VLFRPGKTPSGAEVRSHLRRLVRRIRRHWPQIRITIRGDGYYGRPEVRWTLGVMLGGFTGLLAVMAHGFHWL